MARKGRCPKCRRMLNLTEHHVIPRRIRDNDGTILICRECHDDLERFIAQVERALLRRNEQLYVSALETFLEGGYDDDKIVSSLPARDSILHSH